MVSSKLITLGTPFTRSSLLALSIALMVNAVFLIIAGWQYPFLIGHDQEFYLESIRTISLVSIGVGLAAIGISISGCVVSYKYHNNYLLVHSGLTAIFLPVLILIFFGSLSVRYKPKEHEQEYKKMIIDYKMVANPRIATLPITTTTPMPTTTTVTTTNPISGKRPTEFKVYNPSAIDAIQSNFTCCGLESTKDWTEHWGGYVPASCCKEPKHKVESNWSKLFDVPSDYVFAYCDEDHSHQMGCLLALKEREYGKHAWITDLIVIMIVIIIGETINSFLLFGLTKSGTDYDDTTTGDLSMIGAMATMQHRASQPTIIGMKSRPSVVFSLANTPSSSEQLFSARLQAIRANLNNNDGQTGPIYAGPRPSISGPSKFSAAARRGSSFI